MPWDPGQYEKFKDERSRPFFDLMALVEWTPAMKVADLGCGTGELTTVLHRELDAASTVGIDSSDEMLARAQKLDSPVKFEKARIEKWKPKEKFDLIFSNAALQWCDDHELLFSKIRKQLAAHGQISIQMPMNQDYPTHTIAREMAGEISSEGGDELSIQDSVLPLGEYASMLYRLGFQKQKAYVNVYGHILESRGDVIEWVKGTTLTKFKDRLSPKAYAAFLKEYERRLFGELRDEKPFFYPFKRLFLWARL